MIQLLIVLIQYADYRAPVDPVKAVHDIPTQNDSELKLSALRAAPIIKSRVVSLISSFCSPYYFLPSH